MYPPPAPRFTPLNHADGGEHPLPVMRTSLATLLSLALATSFLAAPARGQFVLREHEDLRFDRPESWAMAWFSSVAYPTALGAAGGLPVGNAELSLEGGYVPSLSARERTVGFLGTKPEDLNRTSVFGRVRLAAALPGEVTATLGWVPPARVGGIQPQLYSLALERALWSGERARLSVRAVGESGRFEGDLTCPASVAAAGLNTPANVYNCEQPSRDEMHVRMWGGELRAGTTLASAPLSPYVGVGVTRLHSEFQVKASYNGLIDRTRLATDGTLWSATLGTSYALRERWNLSAELFYTPIDVVRPPATSKSDDALLNARVALAWRVR